MPNYVFRREELPASEINIKEIAARITNDSQRRATFLERKKIMRDEMRSIIDRQLYLMFSEESYSDMRNYIDVSNNVARRVLREISTVYKSPPDRTVIPKAGEKRYGEITDSNTGFNINGKMLKSNYLLNGLNDLIIQIAVLGDFIDYHIYTPDMVTVFENPDNPSELDALLIEDYFIDDKGNKVTQYIFWSPTRHFIVDKDYNIRNITGNEEMVNPFRDINIKTGMFYPFVNYHNTERENSFWDEHSGTDLFEGTKLIAIQNTFRNLMIPMQFKQLAVKVNTVDDGKSMKSNQVKSPLHILTANGDISVLDWQSNITQLGESIQNTLFGIAGNYGISQENFKLTAQAQSGFARMIAKERLTELREEQVEIWRDIETEVFDCVREVNNLYGFKGIVDTAKFSIDFAEIKNFEDPLIELNIIKQKLELGLINLYDIVKKENPDIKTDEEADEFIRENIELRNSLKSRFGFDFSSITGGQNATGAGGEARTKEQSNFFRR